MDEYREQCDEAGFIKWGSGESAELNFESLYKQSNRNGQISLLGDFSCNV
jgi:hypothetical protein